MIGTEKISTGGSISSTLDGSEDQDHASEEINQKYLMTGIGQRTMLQL